MKSDVIGGEFNLQLPEVSLDVVQRLGIDGVTWFASGRAALFAIVRYILKKRPKARFFLPDYLCFSIIESVEIAGGRVVFYSVDSQLQCDLGGLCSECTQDDVVLLINYFGGIDYSLTVSEIRRRIGSVWLILDEVQAFWEMYCRRDLDVDFVFTSFRKSLPVPDGGWGWSRHGVLESPLGQNNFVQYKIAGGLLKQKEYRQYCGDDVILSLLERGEVLLQDSYEARCSVFTKLTMSGCDFESIAKMRQRNADFVIQELTRLGIRPIVNFPQNAVPLFIPIRLPNRDKVRRALFDHHIYCPVHWQVGKYGEVLARGKELAGCEMSLIIDQRYDLSDMQRMLHVIEKEL